MKVTITLGEKAMEYVTGIPEEELPEILSDVLERSLTQQVKPVQQEEKAFTELDGQNLFNKLKAVLDKVDIQGSNSEESQTNSDESTFSKIREVIIDHVDSSSPSDLGDYLDEFEFLK